MIIEFKPKQTYFTTNAAPAIIPPEPIYQYEINDIDEDEREYRSMMRRYHLQNITIVLFVILVLFAIFNIRISVVSNNTLRGTAEQNIVLFARCFNEPDTGEVLMTEYDFTNPQFDTVTTICDNGYVRFGTTGDTSDQYRMYEAMPVTDTFFTLCIIPLR